MLKTDADKLADTVDEVLRHGHDDLPEGPSSPLGGEVRPNLLTTRSEPEIMRLAELGKAIVDQRISARSAQSD
jgi:hypothetical protein